MKSINVSTDKFICINGEFYPINNHPYNFFVVTYSSVLNARYLLKKLNNYCYQYSFGEIFDKYVRDKNEIP